MLIIYKWKEIGNNMKNNIHRIIDIAYLLVAAFFTINLIRLSVLPNLYLVLVIALLAIIGIYVFRSSKKTMSSIIAILLITLLSLGTFYMLGTLDFFGKISNEKQLEEYYVVVKADSEYEVLEDIEGKNVGIMRWGGGAYKYAQDALKEKVAVKFQESGNYNDLATALINNQYPAIFINSAYYEMAIEEVEGFTSETTRILDQSVAETDKKTEGKPVNVTKDSFNVYISGIDTSGSISNISRSDVNMIVTVNPKTRNILLTSIPRDYHVVLGTIGQYDKLTHSGLYGIDETTSTIENLFGIDINYYARVNFSTVVNLVDVLGGITVNSDYSFYTGVYQFYAGENYLNGDQALAFARERYAFTSGDNQRIRNQQAVISGVINKITTSPAILTDYNAILNAVEYNFQTNMSQKDITSLVKMQLGDMRGWTITQQSVSGSGLMTPVYSMPHVNVYVMQPNYDSVEAATQSINEIMAAK